MSKDINFADANNKHTLTSGLSYYSQTYDFKDSKKWALEWISKNLPSEFDRLKDAKETAFSNRGFVCRMIKMGFKASDEQVQSLNKFFSGIVTNQPAKEENDSQPKRKPQDKVNMVIFQLEDIIDQILSDSEPSQIKVGEDKAQLVQAQAWIEKQIIETHEQIAKQQAILAQLENAYTQCGGVKDKAVTKPKPKGKTESITAEKAAAAKSMKYKKRDDELGMESLSPARIVGAAEVLVYNTKYRTLSRYVAEKGLALSVSHSSIRGFDPKLSTSKTVRKPLEFFKVGDIWKAFDLVKTTNRSVNAHISDQCLIVSVK